MWMIYKSMHTMAGAGVIFVSRRNGVLKALCGVLLQSVPEGYWIYNVKIMCVGFVTKPADAMPNVFKQLVMC